MRRAPATTLVLLALAACGEGAPREAVQTEGQRARAAVDAATQAYGACVMDAARQLPVEGTPGALAQRAVAQCDGERAALAETVAAFHRLGNPSKSAEYSAAVADASVKTLETGLREQAVIQIVTRQNKAG